MTQFKMNDIYVKITNEENENELVCIINSDELQSLNVKFNSPSAPDKMSLPVIVPKELPSGRYRLHWVGFEGGQFDNSDQYIKFSADFNRTYFDHISHEKTASQIEVDDIAMEVLKGSNNKGGSASIKTQIPIQGLSAEKGLVKVGIRDPVGRIFYVSSRIKSEPQNGFAYTEPVIHLKPRHAEGVYKISSVSLVEDFSSVINERIDHRGLHLYRGGRRVQTQDLLERGIRAALTVSPPPPPVEKH